MSTFILKRKYFSKPGTRLVYSGAKVANKLRKTPLTPMQVKRGTIKTSQAIKENAGDVVTVALAAAPGRVATVPAYVSSGLQKKIIKTPVVGPIHQTLSAPFKFAANAAF